MIFMGKLVSPVEDMTPNMYAVEKENIAIFSKFGPSKGSKVLDVGCGDARYKVYFDGRFYVPLDLNCVNDVKTFVKGDALVMPFKDGSFDFVYCNALIEHVEYDQDLVKEISRILKTGGVAVVNAPGYLSYIYTLGRHGYHYYTSSRLKKMFAIERMNNICSKPFGSVLSALIYCVAVPMNYILNVVRNRNMKRLSDSFSEQFKKGETLYKKKGTYLPKGTVVTKIYSVVMKFLVDVESFFPNIVPCGYIMVFKKAK